MMEPIVATIPSAWAASALIYFIACGWILNGCLVIWGLQWCWRRVMAWCVARRRRQEQLSLPRVSDMIRATRERDRERVLAEYFRPPLSRQFQEGETVTMKPMPTGGDPIKVDNAISVHGVPEHIRSHLASLIRRLAAGTTWEKAIEDTAAPYFAERMRQRKDYNPLSFSTEERLAAYCDPYGGENRTARTYGQIRHEFYNAMGAMLDDPSRVKVEAFIRDVHRKGWTMAVQERADYIAKADLRLQVGTDTGESLSGLCVTGPLGSPVVHGHVGAKVEVERDAAEAAAHTAKVRTRREELGHQLLTDLRVGIGMDRDKRHAHQLGATMEALVRSVVETVLDRRAEMLAEVDKDRGRPKVENLLHRLRVAEGHINMLLAKNGRY